VLKCGHRGYKIGRVTSGTQVHARKHVRGVAGRLTAIERTIDDDRYCADVLPPLGWH